MRSPIVSLHAVLLASSCCFASLGVLAVPIALEEDYLEDSAFVQSQVVMGSGVRRVEPLEAGEELEDDESDLDHDTPSLMQGGVCTKKSQSRMQPLDEEEITDEMSALQTEITVKHPEAALEEEFAIEEEDDEYSAMQTEVVMMVGNRHVGTGRIYGQADDEDDGAAFIQNEATVVSKGDRISAACKMATFEDVDDEVSLMQTGAEVKQRSLAGANLASHIDDEVSLIQADTTAQVDRSKILAWDTILAMDVNTEKDEVKQMSATLKKEAAVAKAFVSELSELDMALTGADEDLGVHVRPCKDGQMCGDDSF